MKEITPYTGPVLSAFTPSSRPDGDSVCPTCPVSMWMRSGGEFRCFCPILRHITWGPGVSPIEACDGREAALAKLAQEQAKRGGSAN